MRTVQLYINNRLVDLFNDEQIEVTSSVQNIADIAKVFTDFSQTFTVPCSKNNNAIFEHFYNNDVDAVFEAKERQTARIEINGTPFRRGKVQLEGSELKDGEAYAYRITFYGDVVTLKDLFGDDKLRDLDYTGINHERTGANIQTAITSTGNLDVRYPLISSDRVWQYGDATANDISLSAYAIDFDELFPALKVKRVFEAIEDTYSVTFNGNFLSDKRFTNLFTWWKNSDDTSFTSQGLPLTFNAGGVACTANLTNGEGIGINKVVVKYVDLALFPQPVNWAAWGGTPWHIVQLNIYNTTTSSTYYIDIFKNGVVVNTLTGSGNQLYNILGGLQPNTFGLNDIYTFEVRADGALTFDFDIKYTFFATYQDTFGDWFNLEETCQHTTTTNVLTGYVDWNTTAPDITVSDYFAGVLRMFNLTCYPLDDAFNYQVEPLSIWYNNGDQIDITQYVDVNSILVDRPKLYKEIVFEWKESKSFLNEAFKDINGRPFGGLREYFGYDGGEFNISLPFETFSFNKFTGTQLQVAYSLQTAPSYTPYVPAPVMIYLYESQACDFYFENGTTTANITSYMPFGQDVFYNLDEHTLNFNEEISSLTLLPEANSLYRDYYQQYLVNLFDNKTRIVTVTTILPLRLLNYISLQDAIIIRDKKYRINEMKSNLTTGVVKLVLISDWSVNTRKLVDISGTVGDGGGVISVPVKPVKPIKGGKINISGTGTFTTPSATGDLTTEQVVTFTVNSNATGADRVDTYTFTSYAPDGSVLDTEVFVIYQDGSSDFILTESGGYLLQETLDKILI
jgi:hypothetical protein